MGTFAPVSLYDRGSTKPVSGRTVKVSSWPEGGPVETDPDVITTDYYGATPEFQTVDPSIHLVRITAGTGRPQVLVSVERMAAGVEGSLIAGSVATFDALPPAPMEGQTFVVRDEVALYTWDGSDWEGPVPVQGSATDAAVADRVANGPATRAALGPAVAPIVDGRAVRSYTNVDAMLAGSVPPNTADIKLRSFQTFNDGVRPEYAIGDATPTGRAAHYAAPLPGGKWGYPANIGMHPDYHIHPREYVSLVECAKTYITHKSLFLWDPTRTPAITSAVNIHNPAGNMPVTCSSFVGIVLSGIDYADSLYALGTTQNTRSRPWGLNFSRRPGALHPFQGHRLAQYFLENGQLFLAAEDLSNVEPGDVLFFSKQQPEGPGTEDYFFNIFHVALLLNYGGADYLVHSKSASDPSGIMEDPLDALTTLKSQVTFFARPRLRRCSVSRRLSNVAVTGGALTLASVAATLQSSITDDMATVTFNGTQFNESVLYTQVVTTLPAELRPDQTHMTTVLLVNGGTPTTARIRVTPAGELSIYSNVSISSSATYYGAITYPTRVGHQALGFDLTPNPRAT